MKKKLLRGSVMILSVALLVAACRKKEAPLPDNVVQFEAAEQGLAATQNSITIKLLLTRSTTTAVPVMVTVKEEGGISTTGYEISPGYNITAVPPGNRIDLAIPSGAGETAITIRKKEGALFSGTEKLVLTIYSSGGGVVIGARKAFTLNFSEIISNGASAEINGGGAAFGNKVFIDLSANNQTAVQRTKWDLGFYGGADDFRVILNASTGMMARPLNKTDLNTVTAADTVGFAADMAFNFTPSGLPYIDYPTGELTKTAIGAVAANATENKVYIINRGSGIGTPAPERGWKKVRITRNAGGGYTLQHADIGATTFTSVDVPKNPDYFFKYVSFENGAVDVEPQAKKWDLAWTFFTNTTPLSPGVEIPYTFQDMILQNRNVQTAKVMTATKAYAAFSEADLAGLNFAEGQIAIGSDWRSGGGPGAAPAVRTDRYYIIKDGDGNSYKLRFLSLTRNGERGYPSLEYALIKKGK